MRTKRGVSLVGAEWRAFAYNCVRRERTRERVPLDWATTQNNLGTSL
jgi:hypothetical protein